MESFKVEWVLEDRSYQSVVSYDRPSADERAAELRKEGATAVEVVPFKLL
ncbi:hypothetical protein AB0O57_29155 [Streptomyces sp. NPDC091201]